MKPVQWVLLSGWTLWKDHHWPTDASCNILHLSDSLLFIKFLHTLCLAPSLHLPFERRGPVSIFMAEDNEMQGSLYTSSEGQSWPLSELLPLSPGCSVPPPTKRTGNVSEIEVDAQSLQWISLQWKIILYDFVYLKLICVPQLFSISFFKNSRTKMQAKKWDEC